MAGSALGYSQPPDAVLEQFLDMAKHGLQQENQLLEDAKSFIHEYASSLRFADHEHVYAYLIRRSLAIQGFKYKIRYEEGYPEARGKIVDLAIDPSLDASTISGKFGFEMKWIEDTSHNSWNLILSDIRKLLECAYMRKFLLVFPMTEWSGSGKRIDICQFLVGMRDYAAAQSISPPFETGTILERSFRVQRPQKGLGEFRLVLVEICSPQHAATI